MEQQQSVSREAISLEHLLWIRLVLFAALLLTVLAVAHYMPYQYYSRLLLSAIAAGFLSDPILRAFNNSKIFSKRVVISSTVLFDVLLLTGILLVSGGAANPFSTLLLIYVVVAASLLGSTWGLVVFIFCALCYGALFFFGISAEIGHQHSADSSMSLHLTGMWFSFVVTGGLISLFVVSLTSRLRRAEHALQDAERRSARMERLGLISALSANAAHELSTPLNTIALAADELCNPLLSPSPEDIASDTALIREQVTRCKEILRRLTLQGGQCVGEATRPIDLRSFANRTSFELSEQGRARVDFVVPQPNSICEVPIEGLIQGILNLLRNAIDASAPTARVICRLEVLNGDLTICVSDQGTGIPLNLQPRVLDPFFTTKASEGHLGLGLFLVSQLADDLGGCFSLQSAAGKGTSATLRMPAHPTIVRSERRLDHDVISA